MLSAEVIHEIEHEATLYERPEAACIDALMIVQRHQGWVDDEAVAAIGGLLGMSPAAVDSVATFYNGIYRRPVGRHLIRLCTSVSCWVVGYEKVEKGLCAKLGVKPGATTADGRFTLVPVQCLGNCDHAPTLMVDDDLHHDVDPDKLDPLLAAYP